MLARSAALGIGLGILAACQRRAGDRSAAEWRAVSETSPVEQARSQHHCWREAIAIAGGRGSAPLTAAVRKSGSNSAAPSPPTATADTVIAAGTWAATAVATDIAAKRLRQSVWARNVSSFCAWLAIE